MMIVLLAKKYHKVNFLIFSKADVVRDNLPAAWSYFTGKTQWYSLKQ